MNTAKSLSKHMGNQKGTVLILVAFLLVVLLGITALSVDIGYLMAAKNEAQNVADAAALAATRELGEQHYLETDPINETKIKAVAQEVAGNNTIAGESIEITSDSDIQIGYWNPETSTFSTTSIGILTTKNSVRVTARRSDAENGAINTFFAKVLGIDTFSVFADATAALTGADKAPEGELIPVGISKAWFEPGFCNQPIKFYPTGGIEGCAGWNVFDDPKHFNTDALRDLVDGMADGSIQSPETIIGTEFSFGGGTSTDAFSNFNELYIKNKNATDDWETGVVVYDIDDCSNPKGFIKIVGFATAVIHDVTDAPTKVINATVICDKYNDSRGGGGLYGTYGKIPNLVE